MRRLIRESGSDAFALNISLTADESVEATMTQALVAIRHLATFATAPCAPSIAPGRINTDFCTTKFPGVDAVNNLDRSRGS
jgi:hypothetical protein